MIRDMLEGKPLPLRRNKDQVYCATLHGKLHTVVSTSGHPRLAQPGGLYSAERHKAA